MAALLRDELGFNELVGTPPCNPDSLNPLQNRAGWDECKTEYIRLCAHCTQVMHPKVEVTGDTVTLRLTKNLPTLVADTNASSARIN
jgi:hypothetical protein